ncbi:MAG TPA: TlpA disulfide reductase family protein [Saprospiraceae bacterium]|nr:TlpA disulfide reductase family protein [Saprospiraceae bacterium]HRG65672.1 TlpA disulfide reductase family protein [Saprospiraceae bacterium]
MKNVIIIIKSVSQFLCFIFFVFSCVSGSAQHSEDKSYQAGIEKCKAKLETSQRENPGDLIFQGPDCLIGHYLPDFEVTSIDGSKISNHSLKGRVSVINFWFLACTPCLAEIPGFKILVDKYGTEHFNFIAFGMDSKADIEAYLRKHPWPFSHIADADDAIVVKFKHRWGFPTTFIVDENGIIVSAFSAGLPDERAVAEIQKKISPFLDAFLEK